MLTNVIQDVRIITAWQLPVADEDFLIKDACYELSHRMLAIYVKEERQFMIPYTPIPAINCIRRSLECFQYPMHSRIVDLSQAEHPHYASLGALGDFSDELILFAYHRQRLCAPQNSPYYLDALRDIANGRDSSDLQMAVATAVSMGETGQEEINSAYRFFNVRPDAVESDDHIIGLYRSRIESAPAQREAARECLATIGKARCSQSILSVATDKTPTYEEALKFLEVTADTGSDTLGEMAKFMVCTTKPFSVLSWHTFPVFLYESGCER